MPSQEVEDVHAVHIKHIQVEDDEGDRTQRNLLDRLEAVPRLDELRLVERAQGGPAIFRIVAESSTIRILGIRLKSLRSDCQ
jgi:hypothetical protein